MAVAAASGQPFNFTLLGVADGGPGDPDGQVNGEINLVNVVRWGGVIGTVTGRVFQGLNGAGTGYVHRLTLTGFTFTAGAAGGHVLNDLVCSASYNLPSGPGGLTALLDGSLDHPNGLVAPGARVGLVNESVSSFNPNQVSCAWFGPAQAFSLPPVPVQAFNHISAENELPGTGIHNGYLSFDIAPGDVLTLPSSADYDLEAVPSPGVLSLLGVAGLWAGRRRR
jgi:MYXO-CTERM domain-containing protein